MKLYGKMYPEIIQWEPKITKYATTTS
jgi:hypothetical protein